MEKSMNLDSENARRLRAIFRASGIESRHSVLADYGKTEDFSFYPNNGSQVYPGTEARMTVFREHALPLSVSAVKNMLAVNPTVSLDHITHLIVVCCTGMYAPGLDIDLVKSLKLPYSVQRTCIHFMGCYAAFNALKAADAFCKSTENAKVLIVCTELCSIHFQHLPTEDNILANALFADGSASILVESNPSSSKKLSLESFHSDLAVKGEHDMVWAVGDGGFQMRLSSFIPELIREEISTLIKTLLKKISKAKEQIKYFAIHPGGTSPVWKFIQPHRCFCTSRVISKTYQTRQ
jgi:prepilin-type processing-associated H-X9-DG protein